MRKAALDCTKQETHLNRAVSPLYRITRLLAFEASEYVCAYCTGSTFSVD
jgi:hypothetical protein